MKPSPAVFVTATFNDRAATPAPGGVICTSRTWALLSWSFGTETDAFGLSPGRVSNIRPGERAVKPTLVAYHPLRSTTRSAGAELKKHTVPFADNGAMTALATVCPGP